MFGEKCNVAEVRSMLTNCKYLQDQELNVLGFRIYGSPWQPEFYSWAFNLNRGDEIRAKWKAIPEGIDILITHGPPLGHGDECVIGDRAGCYDLLQEIEMRIKPKVHVFGHIHEGYGVTTNDVTMFINASTCNVRYNPHQLNPAIVFDLPNKVATTVQESKTKS